MKTNVAAIIPARMNSSRYPGKPLLIIKGLPMIEHVRRRTLLSNSFNQVVVATCDNIIFKTIRSYGGQVIMTSSKHKMATDRVAEAVKKINCTHVVNVQGDEILLSPKELRNFVFKIKKNPQIDYWNAISKILLKKEILDINIVKCLISKSNRLIYCSRNFSDIKDKTKIKHIYRVLGILAFTKNSLIDFTKSQRTPIETSQSIDQMRLIENDKSVSTYEFLNAYDGINTKKEEKKVINILNNDIYQKKILNNITKNLI